MTLESVIPLFSRISEELSKQLGEACEVTFSVYRDGPREVLRVLVWSKKGNAQALITEAAAPSTTEDLLVATLVSTAKSGKSGTVHPMRG